jgi:hypothetical protein
MAAAKPPLIGLNQHPKASLSIRRWKSWASLAGFAVAGWAGYSRGLPLPDMLLRAVAGGVIGYLIGYAAAVTVWRHVLQTQAKVAVERAQEVRRRELARQQGGE